MGLDAKARLVVGVKLGSVFQRKTESEKVTRYDVKTGVPYPDVETKTVFLIKGIECTRDLPEKIYEIDNLLPEFKGLNIYYDDYEKNEEDFILGIDVTSTQSYRLTSNLIEEVKLSEITESIKKVNKILDIDDAKIFCILYMSY